MAVEKLNYDPNDFKHWTLAQLQDVDKVYIEAWKDLEKRLAGMLKLEATATPVSPHVIARTRHLLEHIRKQVIEINKVMGPEVLRMIKDAENVAKHEITGMTGLPDAFNTFSEAGLKRYAREGAYIRKFTSSTFYYNQRGLLKDSESILRRGFIQRKTWQEITGELAQRFGATPEEMKGIRGYREARGEAYRAKRLLRTEMARARGLVHQRFADDSSDIIIGIEMKLSSAHQGGCDCGRKAGKYYYHDRTDKRGKALDASRLDTIYPIHPNCMCYRSYIIDHEQLTQEAAAANREWQVFKRRSMFGRIASLRQQRFEDWADMMRRAA